MNTGAASGGDARCPGYERLHLSLVFGGLPGVLLDLFFLKSFDVIERENKSI